MTEENHRVTVEEVRKLALPLGTRVMAGDGLLNRIVSWTTVIYPEESPSTKALQRGEMILYAQHEGTGTPVTTDVELVRLAFDSEASALVVSETPSPAAVAEANAYGMPVLLLPSGNRIRLVEKAIVSLLVDRKGQIERRGTQAANPRHFRRDCGKYPGPLAEIAMALERNARGDQRIRQVASG